MAPSPPPLPTHLPVITFFPLVPPLLICWLSGFLVPQPLPLVAPLPGTLLLPFITPPPFVAPLLFGWLSLCLAPRPRPLVATPPGAASRHTPLVRLVCRIAIARRLIIWMVVMFSLITSLLPVHLRLSIRKAFGVVRGARPSPARGLPHCCPCCACPHARPLPARGLSRHYRCHGRPSPGRGPRRERVQMDDE